MSPDMTGQNAQPKGWRGQVQKAGQVAGTALAGWRGDGSSVPGNQPGGANGQFGRYGQTPDMQPTHAMNNQVAQQAQADGGWGQMAANATHAVQGIQKRYGQQGRMDHSMNQNQQQMHQQGMQASADQLQQPQDQNGEASGISGITGGDGHGNADAASAQPDGRAGYQDQVSQVSQHQQPQPMDEIPRPDEPDQQSSMQPLAGQQSNASMAAQSTPQPASPQGGMASPFGQMNFGGAPQMADGRIVTKPTRAIIGESGPEAVIPLDGHAGSKITPESVGMSMPRRYDATGPTSLHHPIRPMRPMGETKSSGWKRWDSSHPHHG